MQQQRLERESSFPKKNLRHARNFFNLFTGKWRWKNLGIFGTSEMKAPSSCWSRCRGGNSLCWHIWFCGPSISKHLFPVFEDLSKINPRGSKNAHFFFGDFSVIFEEKSTMPIATGVQLSSWDETPFFPTVPWPVGLPDGLGRTGAFFLVAQVGDLRKEVKRMQEWIRWWTEWRKG